MKVSTLACFLTSVIANAQTTPTTIRVSSETVPAGGLAQIKVLLTSPKPITTGVMDVDLSGVFFDSIDGIALFSGTGDVVGAATVDRGVVNVKFSSPRGTFGTDQDYPLLSVAVTLSKSVVAGQVFPAMLDSAASIWRDLLGASMPFEFKQGSITVGGSVAISNVVPGGGALPAGTIVSIYGSGFSPRSKFTLRNLKTSSVQYVSPNEFRLTLKDPAVMDGTLIQVQNPDNSSASYYSYLRGVPVGQSTHSLLTRTVPVFSTATIYEALLPATVSAVNHDYFTAIALQNPALIPATITLESHDAAGAAIGTTQVTLGSGTRIAREISELTGAPLAAGSYLRIISAVPVQALGILANEPAGIVTPIALTVISAPPPPAPTDTSGGGSGGGGGGRSQ
jgi:hypothetical protein